jgi:hypothetical protein
VVVEDSSTSDAYRAFTGAVTAHFTGENAAVATRAVARYYLEEPFTGRYFDLLRDDGRPHEIAARDLVAVEMLSIRVPPRVSAWLLDTGRRQVSDLLRQVPDDVDIWDAGDALARDGALWQLWDLLGTACWPEPTQANGMGRTIRSKLLAAKRPRLVPVLDDVVCGALPPVDNYWAAFQTALSTSEARLLTSVPTAAAGEHVPLLRRVDVVLWMAHRPSDE